MCVPGECVSVLIPCIPADAKSLSVIFLAVRILTKWEGCDSGGLINLTKATPTLQYLVYPNKTWPHKGHNSVCPEGVFVFPCEGQ